MIFIVIFFETVELNEEFIIKDEQREQTILNLAEFAGLHQSDVYLYITNNIGVIS